MRYLFGTLMILFVTLLYYNCADEGYGKTKPYAPITAERSAMHEIFTNILCDTDTLNSDGTSLDIFLLDSIYYRKEDGVLESRDSSYFDEYDTQFWINLGDTILLKNNSIIFNPDQLIYGKFKYQLEISRKQTGDFPYLEFMVPSCCIYCHVNELDNTTYKINFSLPSFSQEVRFELISIE